jgi:hypothetical protein
VAGELGERSLDPVGQQQLGRLADPFDGGAEHGVRQPGEALGELGVADVDVEAGRPAGDHPDAGAVAGAT